MMGAMPKLSLRLLVDAMNALVGFWVRLFRAVERGTRRALATPYPCAADLHAAQQGRMPEGWRR